MPALVNPSTGLTVDAVGECYESLLKAGFKPVEQKQPEVEERPKRRTARKAPAKATEQ